MHETGQQTAEALAKAEEALDKDALKFDEFLRNTDRAAHEAIKVLIGVSPCTNITVLLNSM